MIIGVCGKIGSGKTLFAKVADIEFGAIRENFAGGLKLEVKEWLIKSDITFEDCQLYGTQEDRMHPVVLATSDVTQEMANHGFFRICEKHPHSLVTNCRSICQWWGTEYRRKQNEDYWVEKLLAKLDDENNLYVIDDVRFPNEANAIKMLGGALVRINRNNIPCGADLTHLSETALDDYKHYNIIINNIDIDRDHYKRLCSYALDFIERTVV